MGGVDGAGAGSRPVLFVPHGARTPGWERVGVDLPWNATRSLVAWYGPWNDPSSERPDAAVALPSNHEEKPLFILGGGLHAEEVGELAERVQEKNRRNAPTASDRAEHIRNWRAAVHDALQRRMEQHRRNPVSDPAPNHTRVLRGVHAVWPNGRPS